MDCLCHYISSGYFTRILGDDNMLKNILKEIHSSEMFSKPNISKELNISEEMLESGVEQLVRMGYLSEDMGSPTCESKCSSCAFSRCTTIPIRMFTITDKGNKLLKENN